MGNENENGRRREEKTCKLNVSINNFHDESKITLMKEISEVVDVLFYSFHAGAFRPWILDSRL